MNPLARLFLQLTGVYGRLEAAQAEATRLIENATESKKALVLEAKEEALRTRTNVEQELREHRRELQKQENRLSSREDNLEQRQESLERRERTAQDTEKDLAARNSEIEEQRDEVHKKLESVAALSAAEAREQLMRKADADIQHEVARHYYEVEKQSKEEADAKAKRFITLAIHRMAGEVVSEHSTSVVPLPSDDMKGRLIGREGRNIRAIEAATGVDLIIDDTPEAVTISCFDPVRREVARVTLTMLVKDGRIHPARIEDMVTRAQKEVDEEIWREGEKAVIDASVRGLSPDVIRLLGRLKYRYSYGSNILKHSVEVSLLAGMLASEVGANLEIAKMGGLMHDIGKALTHEVEGTHAEIGADVARKYGIPVEVQRAIMEHHDEEMGSVEAFLVASADAISAARPGNRKDTLENYVRRLQALEEVASSFPGIEKCYAIQAGREVRLMVKPEAVDDISAANLARNVVKKIEESLVYPGQIKVMVVRETRSIEYAK
jgi:ribonuclease Y